MALSSPALQGSLRLFAYTAGTVVIAALVNVVMTQGDEAAADSTPPVEDTRIEVENWMSERKYDQLRLGGHTIFIRHSEQNDGDANAFDRFATLVGGGPHPTFRSGMCVNERGRAEAWLLGKIFDVAEVPIGTVYSSPVCRAMETAQIAFGRVDIVYPNLSYQPVSLFVSREERELAGESFRELVYAPPEAGTNRVLVGHRNQFTDVEGWDWQDFPVELSGVFIFRHEPDGTIVPVTRASLRQLVFGLPLPVREEYDPCQLLSVSTDIQC